MLIAVGLQAVITLLSGVLVWLVWGPMQALSLVAGGGAIVIPNALLAIMIIASPRPAVPVVLLVGELIKVGLSVLLLWVSYRFIEQLSWGALIVGIIAALLSVLLVPWCQQRFDQRSAPDGG
ncbi:MAG: ATP synthase subunit I [Betaproteobacteria bacterium]